MKKYLLIILLLLSNTFIQAQNQDIQKDIDSINVLFKKGNSNSMYLFMALEKDKLSVIRKSRDGSYLYEYKIVMPVAKIDLTKLKKLKFNKHGGYFLAIMNVKAFNKERAFTLGSPKNKFSNAPITFRIIDKADANTILALFKKIVIAYQSK